MKFHSRLFFILLTTVFLVSCGNADDDVNFNLNTGALGMGIPVDDCLNLDQSNLILSIQEQFTTLPGKVSILFKVSDLQGNPVAGLQADQFTIYEQGRNDACFNTISASESFARISSNSQVFTSNTILVLDLSNSVLSNSLDELKSASVSFINNVMPLETDESFRMAIYWFDGEDRLHLLNPITSDRSELTRAVNTIDTDISDDPSTDLYGAVIKSTDIVTELLNASTEDDKIGAASVVIFTDGTDQASRFSESEAQQKVDEAAANISFFTIGLGSEIDERVLTNLGKTFSVFAGDKNDLENTFNDISLRISESANSFYLFEYCSPKRDGSGENNLAIQVINANGQGAVQTSFDATGFEAGCE